MTVESRVNGFNNEDIIMGITELWALIAVTLHLCGVWFFAEWPIIAGPFTWSCLCVEIWVFIVYAILLFFILITKFLRRR